MEAYKLYQEETDFSKINPWWDCDTDDSEEKKKKRKKKRKKERKKAKKRAKKKAEKKARKELKCRLIENSVNTFLLTASDIAKMYAENKFSRLGENSKNGSR